MSEKTTLVERIKQGTTTKEDALLVEALMDIGIGLALQNIRRLDSLLRATLHGYEDALREPDAWTEDA
jgi:hypothetical protein